MSFVAAFLTIPSQDFPTNNNAIVSWREGQIKLGLGEYFRPVILKYKSSYSNVEQEWQSLPPWSQSPQPGRPGLLLQGRRSDPLLQKRILQILQCQLTWRAKERKLGSPR